MNRSPERTLPGEILVDDYVATEHFMISAFWPMLKTNITEEYMDLLADAGITNVQLNYVLDVANYEDNMTIAQMAYERGIGITASEKSGAGVIGPIILTMRFIKMP